MPTINQLSQIQSLSGADQVPVYSATNGDARKASLSSILAYVEANFVSPQFVTQYASPNVNGTNVAVASTSAPTWLVLTPTAPFAAMTITLPAAAQLADGLELLVFTSQSVGALTVLANGAVAVYGAPSVLTANSSFMLRFNALTQSWYVTQSSRQSDVTSGTFVPTYNGTGIVGTVTFAGRYQIVGNQVSVEITITTAAASSFTFTTATDSFTNFPLPTVPTADSALGNMVGDGWIFYVYKIGILFFAGFFKSGSPTYSISAGKTIRFTAPVYLV